MSRILTLSITLLLALTSLGQDLVITGTVLDSSRQYIVTGVLVTSTSGSKAYTDSSGSYTISVQRTDSINFAYRGKSTVWFPVSDMKYGYPFDVSLQVSMADKYKSLKEIVIIKRSYREDSLAFREKYARVLNASTGGLRISDGPGALYGGTPGLDPNEIINLFRFRRNRNLRSLQNRLIEQEQEKFIGYRFSKTLVKRITGLKDGRDLNTFMEAWKPDYEFTAFATDLEFHTYVLEAYRRWERGILPQPVPAYK